jgi:hypothetical protein
MGLLDSRMRLLEYIEGNELGNRLAQVGVEQELLRRVDAWYDEYKLFEAADSFEEARSKSRLTVRCQKASAQEPLRELKGHKGDEPGVATYGPKGKLAGGTPGILSRMTSLNFVPATGGSSRKVELGLHDLSGSLLDPGRAISTQLFTQDAPDGQSVIFMPLGEPDDQRAFHMLNAWGKELKNVSPDLYARARKIRSTMTRIKYASETDMGVNYRWINHNDHGAAPKFRYMPGLSSRVIDLKKTEEAAKGALLWDGKRVPAKYPGRTQIPAPKMTPQRLEELRSAALNYKRILTNRFKYNEIVIAYRAHGEQANPNQNFPLYGVFKLAEKKWNLYKINSDGAQGIFVKSVNDL